MITSLGRIMSPPLKRSRRLIWEDDGERDLKLEAFGSARWELYST